MKLSEIYSDSCKPVISFEVFPPKENYLNLLEEIKLLKEFSPAFISLTCNAGGTQNKSFELIKKIKALNINIMPHFTCITSSKQDVINSLKTLEQLNIKNILALRGDIPQDETLRKFDFNYASELVSFIKEKTNLNIGVAAYPEGHIECKTCKQDIENLKRKVDSGANAIFTQLFFDNNKFYKFVENVRNANIDLPIIAGIMPIISAKQIAKITSLARVTMPTFTQEILNKYENDTKSIIEFGIEQASVQCQDLLDNGFNKFHFYTLNKSYSTSKILKQLEVL